MVRSKKRQNYDGVRKKRKKEHIGNLCNWKCFFCRIKTNKEDRVLLGTTSNSKQYRLGPTYPTLDHIIPQCDGGTYSNDNLVLACNACNENRGSSRLEPFYRLMLQS